MRINGRKLRPSTLEERRLLVTWFGAAELTVPRGKNPYLIARKLRRAAHVAPPEILFVQDVLRPRRPRPYPSPEVDLPFPLHPGPIDNAEPEVTP